MKLPVFNTVEVITAAMIAYKQNGNKIERDSFQNGDKVVRSNSDIALELLKTPELLKEQIKQAEQDIAMFKHARLIATLRGSKESDFSTKIFKELEADTTTAVRLLVWFPKMADSMRVRETKREQWALTAPYSNWIKGEIGDKVVVSFELLEKRYLQQYNMWVATGTTEEGNIVSYFANNENKIIQKGQITGKIKGHNIDKYRSNAKTTMLNYVKVL